MIQTDTDSPTALFDLKIHVNFSVIRNYFGRADGFAADIARLVGSFALIVFACAFQNALPGAVPELPLLPAVWVTAWLCVRRGMVSNVFWCLLAGCLLDSGLYAVPGGSSLILLASALTCRLLWHSLPRVYYWGRCVLSGAFCTALWIMCRMSFFAWGMGFDERLSLVPRQLLPGVLTGALAGCPLVFALLDMTVGLVRRAIRR